MLLSLSGGVVEYNLFHYMVEVNTTCGNYQVNQPASPADIVHFPLPIIRRALKSISREVTIGQKPSQEGYSLAIVDALANNQLRANSLLAKPEPRLHNNKGSLGPLTIVHQFATTRRPSPKQYKKNFLSFKIPSRNTIIHSSEISSPRSNQHQHTALLRRITHQPHPHNQSRTMATTTFHQFAFLPYEIRHDIWESLLPANADPFIIELINALASHILAIPESDNFHRLSDSEAGDLEEIVALTRSQSNIGDSPWADLAACSESRIVALKQVQKLLGQSSLSSWLKKPKFFYQPKLKLDKMGGALMYQCKGFTDEWNGGYHLEMFVFWRAAIRLPGAWIGPGQLLASTLYEEKMERKAAEGRVLRALIEEELEEAEEELSVSESKKRKWEAEEDEFSNQEPEIGE
ncbi:hypothetical protein BDZ45DRAFT_732198 [Acephala macrosclerotiorum]|nr:hypothetical protein BDZ45DRAFT_732198 [Acephala macrosclerotiorum]